MWRRSKKKDSSPSFFTLLYFVYLMLQLGYNGKRKRVKRLSLNLDDKLVVGISSRALFDLEEENSIYDEQGLKAYSEYQIAHEDDILKPGSGFALVEALLHLNTLNPQQKMTEIIIMSRNSADTSLRIFNSIDHYKLDISRATLSGGAEITPYLNPFRTDLFLSANEEDVQNAINADIAAGFICTQNPTSSERAIDQIRIAFDGDAVIFSDESERIYQSQGLQAFAEYEKENAQKPLPEGPFAKLLKTISYIQKQFPQKNAPIRTALVTARNAPAHERVIRTLRAWNVRIDEAFFLGGIEKSEILKAFGAHIFFDDQQGHIEPAAKLVPSAKVPLKNI